jgi:hypothetical protein
VTLHTDADEQLFETRSPLLLNGIDEIASRADLLDRGIGITLSRISDDQRKTEEEIQTGFHAAYGAIPGRVADGDIARFAEPAQHQAVQLAKDGRLRQVGSSV